MICPVCGKEFNPRDYRQKFCSKECGHRYRSKRGNRIRKDDFRRWTISISREKTCAICGNTFKTHKGGWRSFCSDDCYQKAIERRQENKEAIKPCNDTHICLQCGKQFRHKSYGAVNRFCSPECYKAYRKNHEDEFPKPLQKQVLKLEVVSVCPICGKGFVKRKHGDCCSSRCLSEKHRQDKVESIKKASLKHYVCKQCGKEYALIDGVSRNFCSEYCREKSKRIHNSRHCTQRDKRIEQVTVDKDISLDKLIIRDHGICYICGEPVDENDYVLDGNGYFIAGNQYPSIDHVEPLSKGGMHSWDNVKLAHRICNSCKGAS